MKAAMLIFGALLILLGGVWFLQGIDVLPGSFMTGQTRWAVIGGVCVATGLGLIWLGSRRPRA